MEIRSMKQRTDEGKYSFVNRTIQLWNKLPAEVIGNLPCKQKTFKNKGKESDNEGKLNKINGDLKYCVYISLSIKTVNPQVAHSH